MKHTIYGLSLVFAAVLVIAAAMIISGGDVRENEMDKALNTAAEQALEQIKKEGGYEVSDYRELIADFNQALLLHISSDSDIKIDILTADLSRGILDVKITETYQTVGRRSKQASCRKTVILEEYTDKKTYHTVTFFTEGEVWANYSLYEGSLIVEPQVPEKPGYVFRHWKNENGEVLHSDMTAETDVTFDAVFE